MPFPRVVDRGFATREKVYLALADLLESQPYQQISVPDICHRAGISRQAFARSFEGKNGVVYRLIADLSKDTLMETGRTLSWWQANYGLALGFVEQWAILSKALGQPEEGLVSLSGTRIRRQSLIACVEEFCPDELDEELEFEINALSSTEPVLVAEWVMRDMPYSPETLADYLESVVPRRIHDLLGHPHIGKGR